MPQHDLILENGSGAAFRADANSALAALGSSMKGPNAPPAPLAGMVWVDDDTPSATIWTVKQYDGADWIELGRLDVTANIYIPSEGVIAWADVASAATVDLGAQASRSLRLTGTTGISSFGTAASGVRKRLRIATGLTITHNATSLICPGAANLALGVGDIADVESLGSGNWVVTAVQRAASLNAYQQIGPAQVASGVSAVDFTLTAGFRRFRLEIDRGRVATAGQSLGLRCGVGASFDAGGTDYGAAFFTHTVGVGVSGSGSGSFIDISGGLNADDFRSSITLEIDPGGTNEGFQARIAAGVIENTTPSYRVFNAFGSRTANGAKTSIRILASGGANISGTFTLFGIAS
jgi:hypothetical protein